MSSSIILIGVGGAGCQISRGVNRAYGYGLRFLSVDTDALTGNAGGDFALLGGDRLSGRGAGGDLVIGKMAAEDSISQLDEHLKGVRMAVVVTGLGGGTGSGASLIILKHLEELGITTVIFATTPFSFEGDERLRNARSMQSILEENANASFFLPLDKLIQGETNMDRALARAVDTVASGVTLFWRLLEKPGYIKFDAERLRRILNNAGRGRFVTVTSAGENRVEKIIDEIKNSPLLSISTGQLRNVVIGIMAGEDLKLSEIGRLSEALREDFGALPSYELATVNDEDTFSGRLSVVTMLFESQKETIENGKSTTKPSRRSRASNKGKELLGWGTDFGRFVNSEPTIHDGDNLDIPTFIRQNISLEI